MIKFNLQKLTRLENWGLLETFLIPFKLKNVSENSLQGLYVKPEKKSLMKASREQQQQGENLFLLLCLPKNHQMSPKLFTNKLYVVPEKRGRIVRWAI